MCNLYSETKGVAAIRAIVRDMEGGSGLNLPPLPSIFPDNEAPVVARDESGKRFLSMMRWGFPSPPNVPGNYTVQNVRNVASNYWKPHLKTGNATGGRCLVPATSFSEYQDGPTPKQIVWFARPPDEAGDLRPLFFFAGIWRTWKGTRGTKKAPVEGEHRIFAFLTAEPNAVVAPVHAKAMPVILTTPEECDRWLDAEPADALELQRPAPDESMIVVARGFEKQDPR
jgi:putative SOS response-associated peptidase YedK